MKTAMLKTINLLCTYKRFGSNERFSKSNPSGKGNLEMPANYSRGGENNILMSRSWTGCFKVLDRIFIRARPDTRGKGIGRKGYLTVYRDDK